MQHGRVTNGKHSLRYLGPKLWEKLPVGDRQVKVLGAFKMGIRDKFCSWVCVCVYVVVKSHPT